MLNAVDPIFDMPIFEACLEARVTYLDMAMSPSRSHPEPYEECGVKLGDEQFERADVWEDAGLLHSSGSGSSRARLRAVRRG